MGEDFREEKKSSMVLRMISAIEKDYADPDLLDKLMNRFSFGYSHTDNIFKKYSGTTAKDFRKRI